MYKIFLFKDNINFFLMLYFCYSSKYQKNFLLILLYFIRYSMSSR